MLPSELNAASTFALESSTYPLLAEEYEELGLGTGVLLLALRRQGLSRGELERALTSRFHDLRVLSRGLCLVEALRADDEPQSTREHLGMRVTALRLSLFLRQGDLARLTGATLGLVTRDETTNYVHRPLATTKRIHRLLHQLHGRTLGEGRLAMASSLS